MNKKRIRVVTATSLFDGHDASINIFRRALQGKGAEVIHLGHNRSVDEVTAAAIQEDVDAVLVSSYQGGHNEYFRYTVDALKKLEAGHIRVFGGGGGTILPREIEALEAYGVARLYHADEGRKLGIDGICADILSRIPVRKNSLEGLSPGKLNYCSKRAIARYLTYFEDNPSVPPWAREAGSSAAVVGITGTGGSGKSSLTDELVNRFLKCSPDVKVAVLAVDPSKTSTGGALLGDRIRMNAIYNERVYMRSFATRESGTEISPALTAGIAVLEKAGYDVIFVETSGIGQGQSAITGLGDFSIYAMTHEFGAPSQLDKIDMLDLAHFVVINKCKKPGSEDALREVILRQVRNKGLKVSHADRGALFKLELPVYATEANEFNNAGVNQLFIDLVGKLRRPEARYRFDQGLLSLLPVEGHKDFSPVQLEKTHYLAEIADTVAGYHRKAKAEAEVADKVQALGKAAETLKAEPYAPELAKAHQKAMTGLKKESAAFLEGWESLRAAYQKDELSYAVRGKNIAVKTHTESLSGTRVPKVAFPDTRSWADLLTFYYRENLPGHFPFTAGVFPFKRTLEDPKRQFAGEGTPEKTNRRLHFLSRNDPAKRLSIAFDGVTLYGEDPAARPDIHGKIGESGVSICTLDDMIRLFDGFDLSDPATSVSKTINGPAPIILAMFLMTAAHQEEARLGRKLADGERVALFRKIRGTVQADVLKEDMGQNTCIFSLDFALKLMGDVQAYFSKHGLKNYYTVSISGYHIAEAGANPVTQLAFTLANGFHYVEYFQRLGLKVDDFADNLSFFFSNSMDPEYAVIGRVARRIWAVALRDRYGAGEKAQKLKYHIQTSGRSLHAQEVSFNDIRTTCEALYAFYDNCQSLHTNAYDEAVTTPTEESVRRAMAIQLVLSKEFGLLKNENPSQGAYIVEWLTDRVEEAVLEEFRRISFRGGVLGAIEKQYQRSKIQEESFYYETLKHNGGHPLVGVNTFVNDDPTARPSYEGMEVRRSTGEEKAAQIAHLREFEKRNASRSPGALDSLKKVVLSNGNVFEELLNAVRYCSLGQITRLLYELGGRYRRNL